MRMPHSRFPFLAETEWGYHFCCARGTPPVVFSPGSILRNILQTANKSPATSQFTHG